MEEYPKETRNLREVHLVLTDQAVWHRQSLTGKRNPWHRTDVVPEIFSEAGSVRSVSMTQIVECNIFPDMVFRISNDTFIDSGIIFYQIHKFADRYSHGRRRISPDHIDQHLLKGKYGSVAESQKKRKSSFFSMPFLYRVIQRVAIQRRASAISIPMRFLSESESFSSFSQKRISYMENRTQKKLLQY